MIIKKQCERCGNEFTARHPNGKYCSDLCNHKAKYDREKKNKPKVLRTCAVCGINFRTIEKKQITCSISCRGKRSYRLGKEKREKTNLERFDEINPSSNKAVKAKRAKTFLLKTGAPNFFQSDVFKAMMKQRSLEETPEQAYEREQKRMSKVSKTCMERYKKPYACMTDQCTSAAKKVSKINQERKDILGAEQKEFILGTYSYDLMHEGKLIEICPYAYHNMTRHPFENRGKKPINKNYHMDKLNYANSQRYDCIFIRDRDDKNKIIEFLKQKIENVFYARNLTIHEVSRDEANSFLNKYHLQGSLKTFSIGYGLYNGDELIMLTTRGKPRYNKDCDIELHRLCTKYGCSVTGGFEKLLKHYIKIHNPGSIVSYCDRAKFTGKVYELAGFEKIVRSPSIHFYNPINGDHKTANLILSRGFDAIFSGSVAQKTFRITSEVFRNGQIPTDREDVVIKKGQTIPQVNSITPYGSTDNTKLLEAMGYVRIPDCGQTTYILKNPNQISPCN